MSWHQGDAASPRCWHFYRLRWRGGLQLGLAAHGPTGGAAPVGDGTMGDAKAIGAQVYIDATTAAAAQADAVEMAYLLAKGDLAVTAEVAGVDDGGLAMPILTRRTHCRLLVLERQDLEHAGQLGATKNMVGLVDPSTRCSSASQRWPLQKHGATPAEARLSIP